MIWLGGSIMQAIAEFDPKKKKKKLRAVASCPSIQHLDLSLQCVGGADIT
jgi:hypothetical protein